MSTLLTLGLALGGAQCQSGPKPTLEPQQLNFELARQRMVEEQIRARGIQNARVLEAMRAVPRHEFVPEAY